MTDLEALPALVRFSAVRMSELMKVIESSPFITEEVGAAILRLTYEIEILIDAANQAEGQRSW